MTSEILIMNKDCVAMAADSAATLFAETTKIYETNKVFALSKKWSAGLMMYQNPLVSGVPVETLVKEYRKYSQDDELDTIEDYGKSLLNFIEKGYPDDDGEYGYFPIISEESAEANIRRCLYSMWAEIEKGMENRIKEKMKDELKNEPFQLALSPNKIITEIISETKKKKRTPRTLEKKYIAKVKRELNKIFKTEHFVEVMNNISYPISAEPYLKDIKTIFLNMVLSDEPFWDTTGVVISGFGLNQAFPAYVEYNVDGLFWGVLKYKKISKGEITEGRPSFIKTFAQGDVVETFLTGIDPRLRKKIIQEFRRTISENKNAVKDIDGTPVTQEDIESAKKLASDDFIHWLDGAISQIYYDPIVQSIRFLSKKEMAKMAESMINLTSLRKRVAVNSLETVGGPVDVAIISKGEGVIWINRKHYFDMGLNPHFDKRE